MVDCGESLSGKSKTLPWAQNLTKFSIWKGHERGNNPIAVIISCYKWACNLEKTGLWKGNHLASLHSLYSVNFIQFFEVVGWRKKNLSVWDEVKLHDVFCCWMTYDMNAPILEPFLPPAHWIPRCCEVATSCKGWWSWDIFFLKFGLGVVRDSSITVLE